MDKEDYKQLRFQIKVSVYEKAPLSKRSLKHNEQKLIYANIFSDYSYYFLAFINAIYFYIQVYMSGIF